MTDDHDWLSLFEDALQRFNREHYSAAKLLDYSRDGSTWSAGRWTEMAALGWFELLRGDPDVPASPLALMPLLPLFRAAGEGLWREPVPAVMGETAVVVAATEAAARREALLEGLISGQQPLAYAVRERDGGWSSSIAAPQMQARRDGDGYRLQGEKLAVLNWDACAGAVVLAANGPDGGSGFYHVAREAPGLRASGYRSIDGRSLADLQLNQVPAEYLCPGAVVERADAWGSILSAAEAVGVMRGANADTVTYLRERKQFGRPLLGFQVLQHRLVEMHMLERETSALLQSVAVAFDTEGEGLARRVLALRAQAARALRQVTREAVQMHGGMGVTQETRVSHYYRRALMLDSLHGSEDWALQRLADAA